MSAARVSAARVRCRAGPPPRDATLAGPPLVERRRALAPARARTRGSPVYLPPLRAPARPRGPSSSPPRPVRATSARAFAAWTSSPRPRTRASRVRATASASCSEAACSRSRADLRERLRPDGPRTPEPRTFVLGAGEVIRGLDVAVEGMAEGQVRRVVIPPSASYQSEADEPVPRDFANRRRLYTTIFNPTRIANGEGDTLATVIFDVELVRVAGASERE